MRFRLSSITSTSPDLSRSDGNIIFQFFQQLSGDVLAGGSKQYVGDYAHRKAHVFPSVYAFMRALQLTLLTPSSGSLGLRLLSAIVIDRCGSLHTVQAHYRNQQ